MTVAVLEDADLAAARTGDQAAFSVLVERHRRELHTRCYRVLRCAYAADDVVQDTWLRVWRSLPAFEGRSSFRTWLFRIADNACIDALRRGTRDRRAAVPHRRPEEEPVDVAAPSEEEPDAKLLAKESTAMGLLATIEILPPRQRAVLILREVLRWSARDTATLLGATVPAVNSALQRARATLHDHAGAGSTGRAIISPSRADERPRLEHCVHALGQGDFAAAFLLAAAH